MVLRIINGRVIDPSSGTDCVKDLCIKDGRICEPQGQLPDGRTIDASGCYVMPGLVDLHVHLRDPGYEYKETLSSGTAAAVRGGFTAVVAMANTMPVTDNADKVRRLLERSRTECSCRLLPVGSVTAGLKGEVLVDMDEMSKAGAAAFSEDGRPVMNAELYRQGLLAAKRNGKPVLDHAEDLNLLAGGAMQAGPKADGLGVPGVRNCVEDVMTARDILLAKETGAHLHLCHVSTKDSVQMVRLAKAAGINVTAECTPHHLTLSVDDMPGADSNYKMAPPLRNPEDVAAVREGIADGTLDAIATDHAPHSSEEKARPFVKTPNGIIGLETAVPLIITEFVRKGMMTPVRMAELMSLNPSRLIGHFGGTLGIGAEADVTIIDPEYEYTIDPSGFASKSRNTPYAGRKVFGKVMYTIVGGHIAYEERTKA